MQSNEPQQNDGYHFLPDRSHADIAFEASAADLASLFQHCAHATYDVMVDRETVRQVDQHLAKVESEELTDLLFQFLGEIIYLKDAEEVLASNVAVTLRHGGAWVLEATLSGELIDRDRHTLGQDVKAVTYSDLAVKRAGDLWIAHVVLDI